jgi:predicted nucleic acid-binding protein
MIVVDSSVWIDYFSGNDTSETDHLDSLLGQELIAIGDLVLAEVLQGFRADKDFRKARDLLVSLHVVNMLDTTIALKSAANFRALRKKGLTVRKTVDSIIATYCIENRLPLLHCDKDFQPFHRHLGLKNAL